MDISPPHSYSPLPQSIYSQNGLPSPQKSMSPGYESPYGSHRDLLAGTTATTRQNGSNSGQAQAASPASPPHSYSPIPHVYGQNGQTRQNGSNANSQNITITTSAPSPTLSAQSGSLHSPNEQQMDKLWNGKLMDTSPCPNSNASHHHNGSSGFVQITQQQHHIQQPLHQQQQQQQQHLHNQNNREMIGSASPPPSNLLQRVSYFSSVAISWTN